MMRIGVIMTVAAVCSAALPAVGGDGVLPHRSWQFHDPDWEYLSASIPMAAEAGMSRIQLSHSIVMDAEQLWQGKGHEWRFETVRKAATLAHEHGLKVDMWTHELSGLPKDQFRDEESGKPVLSPALWKWLDAKYEHLFELVPRLDGLVLTFAETDHKVYRDDVLSTDPPPVRVAKLIDVLHDVCARRGKLLMVRTFVYEPTEIGFLHEALAAVAERVGKSPHIVVMTKCVPHDWTPYYPFNPLLGDVAGLRQVVEIDLGQEFTGQSRLLHCEVDYVKRVMDFARSKGVIGGVARVEREGKHALGTANEVNIVAFSRLLHDGKLSAETLWDDWANTRYGKAAAPHVIRALRRTYEITNLTYFPLEYWITNHSRVPDWGYAYGHITSRENCKWIRSPKQVLARDEWLHPTTDTLIKISHEKDLAAKLLEASVRDLIEAKGDLAAPDYEELHAHFELAGANIEIFREHNLALAAAVMYQNRAGDDDVTEEELAELRELARVHVNALRDWADRMAQRYGDDIWPGNPARIRKFADQAEERLGQQDQ